jgi:pimeloyl-ACP methyl ester carboxylesterase
VRLEDLPAVPGVRHRTVHANGVDLHVAEAGDGPPLVLVHGWPQHWWIWRKLIPRLAERYRVLAVDLRGMGWSDAPPGDYAKSTFAADLLAFLDAEGIERAKLLTHDWGGYASFLLALDHPDRVERMVALDITPPFPPRLQPLLVFLPVALLYQIPIITLGARLFTSSTRFVRTLIKFGSGPDAQWTDAELDVYAKHLQEPARARASAAIYRTFVRRELFARRSPDELRVPALLLMGGGGLFYKILRPRSVGSLRVEPIPRGGHFLAEEKPDEVLARALPFLEEAS